MFFDKLTKPEGNLVKQKAWWGSESQSAFGVCWRPLKISVELFNKGFYLLVRGILENETSVTGGGKGDALFPCTTTELLPLPWDMEHRLLGHMGSHHIWCLLLFLGASGNKMIMWSSASHVCSALDYVYLGETKYLSRLFAWIKLQAIC